MYVKYFLIILTFIILDAPFLYINKDLYAKQTKAISGKTYTKRYYSALIVYLPLALGLLVLVLPHIRKDKLSNTIKDAIIYGGTFGLACYATFDFTMHFMFEDWTLGVSIMDSIWGGILCSLVSIIITLCS
jgi:uncharacterized membrane protein